jgi:hypothetical protein
MGQSQSFLRVRCCSYTRNVKDSSPHSRPGCVLGACLELGLSSLVQGPSSSWCSLRAEMTHTQSEALPELPWLSTTFQVKRPGLWQLSCSVSSCQLSHWMGTPIGSSGCAILLRHTIKAGHIDITGDTASHGSSHLWSTESHLLSVSVRADGVHCVFTHIRLHLQSQLSHTVHVGTAYCRGLSEYNRGCAFHKSLVSGWITVRKLCIQYQQSTESLENRSNIQVVFFFFFTHFFKKPKNLQWNFLVAYLKC